MAMRSKRNADDEERPCPAEQDRASGVPIGDRFNRQALEQRVEIVISRLAQAGEPLSLGIVEIEGHAELVDAQGAVGISRLVAQVAARLNAQVRPPDQLMSAEAGRFLLILPALPLLEALVLLDRLEDGLSREEWGVEGEAQSLRFNVGVATRQGDSESAADLIDAATRTLHQGRRLAINRHEGSEEREELADLFAARPEAPRKAKARARSPQSTD
jgi:diguanylate cyclase (GGDEF)-like protein